MEVDTVDESADGGLSRLIQRYRDDILGIEWPQMRETLQSLFDGLSQSRNGGRFEEEFVTNLNVLLEKAAESLPDGVVIDCVTNLFRILRNSCAMCSDNQAMLQDRSSITDYTRTILDKIIADTPRPEALLVIARCAVQFLGNYATGNIQNQVEVWSKFQQQFSRLLEMDDTKLTQYVCMVLHTSLAGSVQKQKVVVDDESLTLMNTVIHICVESDCAWGLYVIEDFLRLPAFLSCIDRQLSTQEKILVLEVLMNHLKGLQDDAEITAPVPAIENLQHIASHFKSQAYNMITMATDFGEDNLMALLVVKELESLCIATSLHHVYTKLQEDSDMLTCAVSLLESLVRVGRQGNNIFSSLQKVSQVGQADEAHPVFGLKKDLIRLVGNMVYKHRANQDKVREMEGIPLILDQTSIDGRNPYITQWSVFAVHNLCEDNEANKNYIAALKLEGVDNNQAVLIEHGLTGHVAGEKVVIKKQKRL